MIHAIIREPAVAGQFYPSSQAELQTLTRQYLDEAEATEIRPKALIAPHAGYPFSGPVAGSAFAPLPPLAREIERVVLIGPSHHFPLEGFAVSMARGFNTPLGTVPVDPLGTREILSLPSVRHREEIHVPEHALEVLLPFLQITLGEFSIVPILAGDASPSQTAEVLEAVWGGPETLVAVSSDLSHYYSYDKARELDQSTADAIETLDETGIGPDRACGRVPIQGLLQAARKHSLQARCVDLRNSGDTAGPRDRVVGYGAFLFS